VGSSLSRGPWGFDLEGKGRAWNTLDENESRTSWWGDQYAIQIVFDHNGSAAGAYLLEVWPANKPLFPLVFSIVALVTLVIAFFWWLGPAAETENPS
jgi:hypothetical protein